MAEVLLQPAWRLDGSFDEARTVFDFEVGKNLGIGSGSSKLRWWVTSTAGDSRPQQSGPVRAAEYPAQPIASALGGLVMPLRSLTLSFTGFPSGDDNSARRAPAF